MSIQSSVDASRIEQLKAHLKAERYSDCIQQLYPHLAQRFLKYLESKKVAIEDARPSNLDDFMRRELWLCRKRNVRVPVDVRRWRWRYTRPIHMLLRLVHGWRALPKPVRVYSCKSGRSSDTIRRIIARIKDDARGGLDCGEVPRTLG